MSAKRTGRRAEEAAASPDRVRAARRPPERSRSKAAARGLRLAAKAQADLLAAANAALRELRRLDALVECRREAYIGLRDALHGLDALDGPQPPYSR